jgi:hypothetical protein
MSNESYHPPQRDPHEDRFRDGFIDGFTRAREIFWRDLMRKAGECRLMSEVTDSESLKEHLAALGHTLFILGLSPLKLTLKILDSL